jgi:tetratricopeptide (TPR) repeat protein
MQAAQGGDTAYAVDALESLESRYPNHPKVAEALGMAYQERGNFLLAANYYQKAARISPDYSFLLLDSARNLLRSDRKEDAMRRLGEYLARFPEDGVHWLLLGRLQYEHELMEAAMDSFSNGFRFSEPSAHEVEDYRMMGELFLRQRNFPQADLHLNKALELAKGGTIEPFVLRALIQSSVQQDDLAVARIFLNRLEFLDPVMADSVSMRELKRRLAEDEAAEPAGAAEKAAEEAGEPDAVAMASGVGVLSNPDGVDSAPSVSDVVESGADTSGSIPGVGDGSEMALPGATGLPDEVSAGEAPEAERSESPGVEPAVETVGQDAGGGEQTQGNPVAEGGVNARTKVQLARQLLDEGHHGSAIRALWDAINLDSNSAGTWFLLSYAYQQQEQYLNAEAAALESMRLNPRSKTIALHYLGILQRSSNADRFHQELLRLYQPFNQEPEFILALARSYARIKNDPENAQSLYRRFLALYPEHPKVAQAMEELETVH